MCSKVFDGPEDEKEDTDKERKCSEDVEGSKEEKIGLHGSHHNDVGGRDGRSIIQSFVSATILEGTPTCLERVCL